ncbi:MAG: MFS transporter [Dehalococcoidia bacterium]
MRGVFRRFGAALVFVEFRNLWMATALAQAAGWGLIVTRGWLIYHEAESSFLVGVATFAAMGPMLVVPPIVGVLADRMDRRIILQAAYATELVQSSALVLLAATGILEVWMVVAASLVSGVARAAAVPTAQATAATLVPPERLLNALSLTASTQHGSRLFGPGLVTPLLAVSGPPAAFAVSAVLYALALHRIRRLSPQIVEQTGERESFFVNFMGGLAYVYERPVLRFMILILVAHCGFTMAFESLLPSFSAERLDAADEGFGLLMMGVGSGALVASLLVSGLQTERGRGNALIITGVLSGLGQVLLGLTTSLAVGVAAAAIMGGAQAAFMTMGSAVTQSIAVNEFRGRVSSINSFSLGGTMAMMNLLNGSIAEEVGARPLLLIHGALFVVIVAMTLLPYTGRQVYGRAPIAQAA